jgi:hypothetical protein
MNLSSIAKNITHNIDALIDDSPDLQQKVSNLPIRILISFHCGHGVLPTMSGRIYESKDIYKHTLD